MYDQHHYDDVNNGQDGQNEVEEVARLEPEDYLCIQDSPLRGRTYFVACLMAPAEDLTSFTLSFHEMLRRWGFRVFLQERDLLAGGWLLDWLSRIVEERCNGKLIIILSKYYNSSPECLFLTHFTKQMDPDAKKRCIIPIVIDKKAVVPSVLKGVSLIHYNQAFKCGWLRKKMIEALSA